jgi:hypothetical protein
MRNKQRRRMAGDSALAMFRDRRRAKLREHWRDWAMLIVAIAGSIIAVLVTTGVMQLVFAGLVGALITVAVVGWLVGDVRALRWAWGAAGERDTQEVLERLGDDWTCVHDIPSERGNWDHVLVGPPGVFLLDTKVLGAPARASDDALRAGRQVMPGGGFRGAAAGLSDALGENGGRPWVQPVVVIWGDFEQRIHEELGVVYASGADLVDWLAALPLKTQRVGSLELVRRVEAIASGD